MISTFFKAGQTGNCINQAEEAQSALGFPKSGAFIVPEACHAMNQLYHVAKRNASMKQTAPLAYSGDSFFLTT
jgi:hypothetical protein